MNKQEAGSGMTEIVARKVVYTTPFCDFVAKTVRGEEMGEPYYTVKVADYVAVLCLTPEQEIVLVKQYRPTVETQTLELPAGTVDPNESPENTARRELLEETGFVAKTLIPLGWLYADTGRLDNRMWCYFAPEVKRADPPPPPEAGVEALVMSLATFQNEISAGNFRHALHLAVLSLAQSQGCFPSLTTGVPRD